MRFILLIIFIFLPLVSYGSLNGTYLICELTQEYSYKEKEVQNQNYIFFFFRKDQYEQKKVIKHVYSNEIDFTFESFNYGKYNFVNEKINLIDNIIFRKKRFKSELNRNTMILKSNHKDVLLFEYLCELSDLEKIKKKSMEIIKKSEKFWNNKFKDNKI
tara:strand:- start:7502 stop:7978 length:477 start_codon:yes stop_codon:yes gene_type:complete